jgi:Putative adhesin
VTVLEQPAAPRRTPARIRLALATVAALLAVGLVGFGTYNLLDVASRNTTTERASYDGVSSLVVDDAGDVRLIGAPSGAPVEVIARVTEGLHTPDRSAERGADGTLRLSASCPGPPGGQCDVSYEIRVPSGTPASVHSDNGDVMAEDVVSDRPIVLDSSAGDVEAIDVSAPSIALSPSAGDVEASGLSAARIEAESSAGDVVMALRTPAERLVADSSAGDVELLVPDAVYRLDASSSAGDVETTTVSTDPGSERAITAHSSAGDVRVAARG